MDDKTYDIIKYDVNEVELTQLAIEYSKLKVLGVNDKENYEIIRKARLDVVKHRTAIEAERKKYKEKALKYGRDVDAEAKRLTAIITPIERYLTEQEEIVANEIARIKAEAEAIEAARIQTRIDRLFALGCSFNGQNYLLPFAPAGYTVPSPLAKACNDEQFEVIYGEFQKLVDTENKRVEDEKAAKIAEEERLAKIKEEQESESKRLAAIAEKQAEKERKIKEAEEKIEKEKQRLIDEENERVAAAAREQQRIEDEKKRVEELEKAKKEAAERAIKDAEEKASREQAEKEEREQREKEEEARQEMLKPDKDKLMAFADSIDFLRFPDLSAESAQNIIHAAKKALAAISNKIRKDAREL